MASIREQFPSHRPSQPVPLTKEQRAEDDTTLSPQDFYREMVERPDVRRILGRLAQFEDDGAKRR